MVVFRHHKQSFHRHLWIVNLPVHSELLGDAIKLIADIPDRRWTLLAAEYSAHKEFIGRLVIKLFECADIAVSFGKETGHGGHHTQPGTAGASEDKIISGLGHSSHSLGLGIVS